MRKFDQTRKELEYYRDRNKVMINRIEQADQESYSLCAKLAVEKQILNRSEQVYIFYCFLNIGRSNTIDFTKD